LVEYRLFYLDNFSKLGLGPRINKKYCSSLVVRDPGRGSASRILDACRIRKVYDPVIVSHA
jgi:hypothetical protein